MYVAVAVCDKTFHAIQHPCAVLFLCGLEHYALKVGAGIRLGKVHRHCFAFAHTGYVLGALLLAAEFIEGFGTVLKSPQVFKAYVGTAHDFRSHNVGRDRHIQATEATRHRHTHKACLAAQVEVFDSAVGVMCATVGARGALMVYGLGVFGDTSATNLANNFEHLFIAVHRIGEISRSIVEFFGISIVSLTKRHYFFHQRVMEVVL